jgi:hypothetical protein
VEERKKALAATWPCAWPTQPHRCCPRHRKRVGPVSWMCTDCFYGFYDQIGREFTTQ